MQHRAALSMEATYDQAALVGALARYRSVTTSVLRSKEGRALISALQHVSPKDFYGPPGWVLTAEAYRDLGFLAEFQRIAEEGLQDDEMRDLRPRLLFGIADSHLRVGDRERGLEVLLQLSRDDDPAWQRRAMFQLAELSCRMGRDDMCKLYCADLLAGELEHAERQFVLGIVGRLLEKQGNYHGAALCFAGVSPFSQQSLPD
jgi:hypothetical protein